METVTLGPGDFYTIAMDVPHAVQSGLEGSRALVISSPAGFAEIIARAGTPVHLATPETELDAQLFMTVAAELGDVVLGPARHQAWRRREPVTWAVPSACRSAGGVRRPGPSWRSCRSALPALRPLALGRAGSAGQSISSSLSPTAPACGRRNSFMMPQAVFQAIRADSISPAARQASPRETSPSASSARFPRSR